LELSLRTARTIAVAIKKVEAGLCVATSDEEPTFFLMAVEQADFEVAIARALSDFVARQYGKDFVIVPTDMGDRSSRRWVIVARELLGN
jgi:hypothetical protein